MVNKAILVGNVGKDPEIKTFSNGGRVANFSLATSKSWKDKDGNKQEKTEWHRISILSDGLVGVVEKYVKKGSKLFIEGAIETRKYTDSSGVDKYTTEIILRSFGSTLQMLDKRSSDGGFNSQSDNSSSGSESSSPEISDDDIPF